MPVKAAGEIGVAARLRGLNRAAAARTLNDADDRDAQFLRHPFGQHGFLGDRCIGRTATHREVVARDDNRAAVDRRAPGDTIGGQETGQPALLVIGALAGYRTDLAETAAIDETFYTLTDGETPAGLLAGHLVGPPHLAGEPLPNAKLIQLRLPALLRLALERIVVGHLCVPRCRALPSTCQPRELRAPIDRSLSRLQRGRQRPVIPPINRPRSDRGHFGTSLPPTLAHELQSSFYAGASTWPRKPASSPLCSW